MRALRKLLPYTADFEGCAFKLRDRWGQFLKKPWRLSTDHPTVASTFARYRCDRTHSHGQSRGKDARATENYTPGMVRALTRSLSQAVVRSRDTRDVMVGNRSTTSASPRSRTMGVCNKNRKFETHLVTAPL